MGSETEVLEEENSSDASMEEEGKDAIDV